MKRIRFLLLLAVLFLGTAVFGQNEKFKALFIYNFTNYIDWPSANSGSFVITVIGESPIIVELESISKLKKVNGLPIEVKKATSIAEAGKSQIVFVPSSKKKMLGEVDQRFSSSPTLIIADGAGSNFGINFVEVDSKQSFQISKSNIEAHKLKVSSALLTLGIAVN